MTWAGSGARWIGATNVAAFALRKKSGLFVACRLPGRVRLIVAIDSLAQEAGTGADHGPVVTAAVTSLPSGSRRLARIAWAGALVPQESCPAPMVTWPMPATVMVSPFG